MQGSDSWGSQVVDARDAPVGEVVRLDWWRSRGGCPGGNFADRRSWDVS